MGAQGDRIMTEGIFSVKTLAQAQTNGNDDCSVADLNSHKHPLRHMLFHIQTMAQKCAKKKKSLTQV